MQEPKQLVYDAGGGGDCGEIISWIYCHPQNCSLLSSIHLITTYSIIAWQNIEHYWWPVKSNKHVSMIGFIP